MRRLTFLAAAAAVAVVPRHAPADEPPDPLGPTVFAARSGPAKAKAAAAFGGSAEADKAVEKGLAWLATLQRKDGTWDFGAPKTKLAAADTTTPTAMAVLAYLGAGHTPKTTGPHKKAVDLGLKALAARVNRANGKLAVAHTAYMYSHGITALALCEGYAVTSDATLKVAAQLAVNLIVTGQGADGSWGYQPGTNGDTSIGGWQLQALFAAKQAKLTVPPATTKKAVEFLDKVASGEGKSVYAYRADSPGAPGSALTAIGLWSRYHFDGWTADTPGMKAGVAGLTVANRRPRSRAGAKAGDVLPDVYHFYYATQVLHRIGGDAWTDWNEGKAGADGARPGGLRDWLVGTQAADGSWAADRGQIGDHCGPLGTTALALLMLETPYRYVPLDRVRPGKP